MRFLFLAISILLSTTALARLIDGPWDYENLTKQADLIVIASYAKSKKTDKSEPTSIGIAKGMKVTESSITFDTNPLMGKVNLAEFKVQTVLKGKIKDDSLVVKHLRIPEGLNEKRKAFYYIRGPRFIKLKANTSYIMFLKKDKDGSWIPLSGQTDPWLSINELKSP